MGMYKSFKTDENLETNGIVIDYGDFRVTIGRAGGANKRFLKLVEAKTRPHRRAIQTENFDRERSDAILMEVYADAVILDWEVKNGTGKWKQGIESPDGKTLPFSKANILATFQALPDLFLDLMAQAQNGALFRASLREEATGNSSSA